MGTETRQKGTIFCTKEQFDTLMSTGSVTIDGTTYTYEDGWQYAVIDKDYVDLTSDQDVQGTKVFGRGNDDTAVVKIGPNDHSQTLISVEGQGPQAGNSVALTPDGIEFTQGGGTAQSLTMPTTGGTILVGIFRHSIKISDNSTGEFIVITAFTSSSAEINTPAKFASYIEASGTGETIYCDGVFAGSTAPMPCAVELVNNSGNVGVRYGTNGQGLTTFSVSS